MLLRKSVLFIALGFAVLVVSAGVGFAIDLKVVQPAKPMQPVQPVKPGLTGIVPALPDLTVLQSSFVAYPPIVAGDPVGQKKLRFSVRNVGKAASGRFEVEITCGYTSPVCPGGFNGFSSVPPLAPGALYEIKWPPLVSSEHTWQAGNYALIVNVDAGNAVKEVGEVPGSGQPALNEHIWDFTVGKGAPKVPSGLTLKPSAPAAVPSKSAGELRPIPPPGATLKPGKPGEERYINPQPEPPGLPKVSPASKPGVPTPPKPFLPGVIESPPVKVQGTIARLEPPKEGSPAFNQLVTLQDGREFFLQQGPSARSGSTLIDMAGRESTLPDGEYRLQGGGAMTVAGGTALVKKDATKMEGFNLLPDLIMTNLVRVKHDPKEGDKTENSFKITIRNLGWSRAGESILQVSCFHPYEVSPGEWDQYGNCPQNMEGGILIPGLEENQTYTFDWPYPNAWSWWSKGIYNLYFWVDMGKQVQEFDEYNNKSSHIVWGGR